MEEVVKAMLQAVASQQEASRVQQEATRVQQMALEETGRRLTVQLEATQEEQRKDRETLKEVLQQLASTAGGGPGIAASSSTSIRASHYLQKMTAADDVEAYLTTFERTAEREGWPVEQWAGLLAPFLTGEPQKAYFDLEAQDAKNYDKLKMEILKRLGVTVSVRAQRVHNWIYQVEKPPRSQMHDLIHLTKKWLQPEVLTGPQMVERVVMDQYLRSLPIALRKWVSHGDPKNADQLVEMVERYTAAEELMSLPQRTQAPQRRSPGLPGKTVPRDMGAGRSDRTGRTSGETAGRGFSPRSKNFRCYRCDTPGHVVANCPLPEPMQCDIAYINRRLSLYAQLACAALPKGGKEKQMCTITVDGREVRALLDTGSLVTLVTANLVPPRKRRGQTIDVTCIHGDTRTYHTARVNINTRFGVVMFKVGVVPALMHDAILGRDFPHFWELWENKVSPALPVGEDQNVPHNPEPRVEVSGPGDVSLGDEETFPFSVMAGEPEEDRMDVLPPDSRGIPDRDDSLTGSMPDLDLSKGEFGTEQLKDPTLSRARENVRVIEGKMVEPDTRLTFPHMAIQNALLYQVVKKGEDLVNQLVVPRAYRRTVLELAHGHLMGGHLGVEKTVERILQRFFWPGLHREVKDFCESCPECQVAAPRPHYRSPLVPLPIIEVPFERIAMDLVGPIVKSARGHQHILVIMDYATRYPEVIPLRNTSSKTIAKELVQVFSRVGIPKEILTDQGTPFMSRVMKELCRLFKVKQLRTSVYHPQTDGLVERFNKTLKAMLKKVVDKDGKNWDFLLPYLMFAIREVPQSSTGYSPFELLYGRHPRGLLDIAKETWEGETTPYKSVIEHIAQMQDRISAVMPIVKEHMIQAQEAQQRVYNRRAQVRTFSPGDRVLVLIPTVESKFLAKWQGPYEVIEKLSEVNYKIRQPGRRKPEQVYHVNLLKPWKDRHSLAAHPLSHSRDVNSDIPLLPEVAIPDSLSSSQKVEVQGFLLKNKDFFSEIPGRTTQIKHDIITEPGKTVKLRPYRIPEARRGVISEEVRKMLELGVIEESHSQWCSPIVLIPKPDGTWRFCNDFRKLNSLSKFDAYPMPRVDELIDRLGNARYITTLDLTKGYWQIPLTAEAREKTAFATPDGLFHYVVLPFGLHGAPATFQRVMDKILIPHRRYAAAYLDDIIIQSLDWDTHLPRVQAVIDSLVGAGFTANPKKCALGLEEAKYLGYTIGRGLIKPQERKIEAIQGWPRPVNKKQVRAFLGITGYYRRFIQNFASLAAPLTNLTKGKDSVMVKWTPEAEKSFQTLKNSLCAQPVLVTPDFKKKFILQTDASDVGLGAVLSQVRNGEEHPVLYLSRKLNDHEKNYAIVEKECLAIKWALEALRYYLLGRHFDLVTDHAPLKWMCENKEKNRRVTRWFLAVQEYRFTVKHRPGNQMGNADALSRVHCLLTRCVPATGLKQGGRICGRLQGTVLDGVYIAPRLRAM